MALIVLEEFNMGIAMGPRNSCVLNLNTIKGFPEGMDLVLQLGPETTKGIYETLQEAFNPGPQVEVATPEQARREAEARAGLDQAARGA